MLIDKRLERYLKRVNDTNLSELDGYKALEAQHLKTILQADFLDDILNISTQQSVDLMLSIMIRISGKCANLRNLFLVSYGMLGRYLSAIPSPPADLGEALVALRKGEKFGAIAITEITGGSNPKGQATRVERSGGRLRLSGEKRWITCGAMADFLLVQAWFDDELRFIYVPTRVAGVEVKEIVKPMGGRGSGLAVIKFEGVVINGEWICPEFLTQYGGISSSDYMMRNARLFAGASALGIGIASLEGSTRILREKSNSRGSLYVQGDWQTRVGKLYIEMLAIKGFLSNISRNFESKMASTIDDFAPFKVLSTDFSIRSAQTYVEASGADAYGEQSEPNRLFREALAGLFIEGGNAALIQRCVSDWTRQSILGGVYEPF